MSLDTDPHTQTGFRLTPRSAAELVLAVALATGAIVLTVGGVLGMLTDATLREVAEDTSAGRIHTAADRVAALQGEGSTSVPLVRTAGPLLLLAGKLEAAQLAGETLVTQAGSGSSPQRQRWRAEGMLLQALTGLTDPETASDPAMRTQAKQALREAALPEAQAALGQLALDEGQYDAARQAFTAVLAATDPPPGRYAAAIAYNGRGLCRLATPASRRDPAAVARAVAAFRSADAYRLPWSPPIANRDRAVALWIAAQLRRTPKRDGAATEAIYEQARAMLGYSPDKIESATRIRARINRRRRWQTPTVLGEPPRAVTIGALAVDALEANHRAVLLPPTILLRTRWAMSHESDERAREQFAEYVAPLLADMAEGGSGSIASRRGQLTRIAAAVTQNRRVQAERGLDRAFTEPVARAVFALAEDDDPDRHQQTALAAAQYVAAARYPWLAVAEDRTNAEAGDPVAAAAIVAWARSGPLPRLQAAAGSTEDAPAAAVVAYLAGQFDWLASRLGTAEPAAWRAQSLRFAAALPTSRVPDEVEDLTNPARVGEGPQPPQDRLTMAEAALLMIAWEREMRPAVDAAWDRTDDDAPAEQRERLRDLLRAQLRMRGLLSRMGVDTLPDGSSRSDAERVERTETRLREVAEWDE